MSNKTDRVLVPGDHALLWTDNIFLLLPTVWYEMSHVVGGGGGGDWNVGGILKCGQRGAIFSHPRFPEKVHFGATEETFLCLVPACAGGGD